MSHRIKAIFSSISLLLVIFAFAACQDVASDSKSDTASDESVGINIVGEDGIVIGDAPQSNENVADPVQATAVDPCEWSKDAVTFEATGPIYKSSTFQGTQDTSTTLSWTVNTNCTPSKLIIESFDGSSSEYSGAKAQSWTKQIPALSQSATFKLVLLYKKNNQSTVVLEKSIEVPVIVMEDTFDVSVTACNNETSTESKCELNTNLTPQNDYKDPSDYLVTFSMTNDPELKLCIRSPHAGIEAQASNFDWKGLFIKQAYAEYNELAVVKKEFVSNKGFANKTVMQLHPGYFYNDPAPSLGTVVGKVECFDENNMTMSADGTQLIGQFEFKATASTDIVYYAERAGVKFMEATIPLKVKIIHPSSVLDVKRAIPGVGAKNYDLVLEEDSPVLEFKVKLSDGEHFALVTDATDKLYSESTWTASSANMEKINGQSSATPPPAAKEAICKIDSEGSYGNSDCKDKGYDQNFIEKVQKVFPKRKVHVFKFNQHDLEETYYYARAIAFDTKSAFIGFGYGDYLRVGVVENEGLPAPQIRFAASMGVGTDYKSVDYFCTDDFRKKIFEGPTQASIAGKSRGLKSLTVERTGCSASGNSSVNDVYGEEGVFDFHSTCHYNSLNPGWTLTAVDFLGKTHTKTCKYAASGWPIYVTLEGDIGNNIGTDHVAFKVDKHEQGGPNPYLATKFEAVSGHSCTITNGGEQDWTDPRDYADHIAPGITNVGLNCWKARLKVKMIDGKWYYVRFSAATANDSLKSNGYVWEATQHQHWATSLSGKSESQKARFTLTFPPPLKFDLVGHKGTLPWGDKITTCGYLSDDDLAGYDLHAFARAFYFDGKHVTKVSCGCTGGCTGQGGNLLNVSDAESFANEDVGFVWAGEKDGGGRWDFTCTATGVAGQEIKRDFHWSCPNKD